jgi:hypothetical protein
MSAGAAAAAAAERARRQREEEEEMTNYSPQDLNEGWEFKIIRSAVNTFKDPARLQQILEEEARAGWQLVEKFDNQRVRLKRPVAARAHDASLGFDPYRITVGMTEGGLVLRILACVFGALLGVGLILFIIIRNPR